MASADVDDVAQEVLLGAWRALQAGQFLPAGGSIGAALARWLRGIARRQARYHRRRSARRGVAVRPDDLVEPAVGPDLSLERRAELAALGELAGAQQLVLVLMAEGHSVEEIGDITGVHPSTAWARLRAARSAGAAALARHQARERFAEARSCHRRSGSTDGHRPSVVRRVTP
ncbi:sigma-70 family RNA polymerase sigma factor [Sorangium sp. So ce119]|uniref:sigma-70 family RNA polymerase sigma factor n=1 Tax=Sorangium sp. So ce119 TaxID=3133279 RepID=UPI003F6434D4